MIFSVTKNQTLALAGVFQASQLVAQLANDSEHNESCLWSSAMSVLNIEAQSITEVYGDNGELSLGLQTMQIYLDRQAKTDSSKTNGPKTNSRDIYQYVISMYALSAKLEKLPAMSGEIGNQLSTLQQNYERRRAFNNSHDKEYLFAEIADIYTQTISKLSPRIIVQGDSLRLKQQPVVNKIRSALFAGIRASYLWSQLGGRRMQILFNQQNYVKFAQKILTNQHYD